MICRHCYRPVHLVPFRRPYYVHLERPAEGCAYCADGKALAEPLIFPETRRQIENHLKSMEAK
jgi:hypothetical protein